jgi:hypothetical protein
MTRLTGAALDRAVANAMGLKSVNNCEQWGEEMTRPIGISVPHRRVEEDDIQDYKKPWVGLTDEEKESLINKKVDGAYLTVMETIELTEAKLKEKNT